MRIIESGKRERSENIKDKRYTEGMRKERLNVGFLEKQKERKDEHRRDGLVKE